MACDVWKVETYRGTYGVWTEDGTFICEVNRSLDDVEEVARLLAAAPKLLAACQEFVRKVECGEARSRRSYAEMKAIIDEVEA